MYKISFFNSIIIIIFIFKFLGVFQLFFIALIISYIIIFIKRKKNLKLQEERFLKIYGKETETKKASGATSLYCYSFDFPQSGYGCVAYRHSKKANMSYVDLHVSQVTVKDVPTDYSKAPWANAF